jgi:GTP pyrophosphokinase
MEWHQFLPSIGHLPARSHTRIKKAFELGKSLHEGQTRKSGEPYFIHPMAVAGKLAEAGADEDTIIAALLHDTVEDTPATLEDIERKFGPAVKTLIDFGKKH